MYLGLATLGLEIHVEVPYAKDVRWTEDIASQSVGDKEVTRALPAIGEEEKAHCCFSPVLLIFSYKFLQHHGL